jgi:photosystem II stability/assembly factor-like uncharacterized protein
VTFSMNLACGFVMTGSPDLSRFAVDHRITRFSIPSISAHLRKSAADSWFLLCAFFLLTGSCAAFQKWNSQTSGTDAQLRGISAVSAQIAWASGTKGTVLKTLDGGQHWLNVSVSGAEALDFRDIQAFDANTAFVLSIGPGEQSRIYKTSNGGAHWQLQFTNHDPKAFYDCFAFWDRKHGLAVSDSVDGRFPLLITNDGENWAPLHPRDMPNALANEGAFAASGTCLVTLGNKNAWFVTGGPAARIFHSSDRGQTWTVSATPIQSGEASQGIFSVVFWRERAGAVVGGDYKNPKAAVKNAAYTVDGGKTWNLAAKSPAGYRSAVAVVPGPSPSLLVAVGTTGSDYSADGGKTWTSFDQTEYNAVSFASSRDGWAVGPQGRIAHFVQ